MRTTSTGNCQIGEPRRRSLPRAATAGGLMALVLVGLFGSGRISGAIAQEGTPAAEMVVEGATFEPLAFGVAPALPPAPASFALVRVTIAPGGHISVPADDPELVLIYVESGTLTASATDPVRVLRGALLATPEAQPFEGVAAGTEYTMGPGDSSIGGPNSGGESRNEGTDEVVLLIAGLQPEGAATPAP